MMNRAELQRHLEAHRFTPTAFDEQGDAFEYLDHDPRSLQCARCSLDTALHRIRQREAGKSPPSTAFTMREQLISETPYVRIGLERRGRMRGVRIHDRTAQRDILIDERLLDTLIAGLAKAAAELGGAR